jgi:kinesin family member C2/C3
LNYATLLFDVHVVTLVIFSQNAPTQSLISVVNGILDESIERKKGEIPHVCVHFELHYYLSICDFLQRCLSLTVSSQRVVYLLRKVVQEIEHRLCIQAEHIRSVR